MKDLYTTLELTKSFTCLSLTKANNSPRKTSTVEVDPGTYNVVATTTPEIGERISGIIVRFIDLSTEESSIISFVGHIKDRHSSEDSPFTEESVRPILDLMPKAVKRSNRKLPKFVALMSEDDNSSTCRARMGER